MIQRICKFVRISCSLLSCDNQRDKNKNSSTKISTKKITPCFIRSYSRLSDPAGTRTQDPYIKSVMLYQLSYGIGLRFATIWY